MLFSSVRAPYCGVSLKRNQLDHMLEYFLGVSLEMLMSSSISAILFILLSHSFLDGACVEFQWRGVQSFAAVMRWIGRVFRYV